MLTLWDLLRPLRPQRPRPAPPAARVRPSAVAARAPKAARAGERSGAARSKARDRYASLVSAMLAEHGVRVRKWRSSMSGVAWEVTYEDGKLVRLIEAPRPKGPMSAAIFLHEIGHHAIGFHRYRPRCLEEYHAWAWALEAMERSGVAVTDSVKRRMHESLHYAIEKARRRGLKELPAELAPFMQRPAPRRRARRAGALSR